MGDERGRGKKVFFFFYVPVSSSSFQNKYSLFSHILKKSERNSRMIGFQKLLFAEDIRRLPIHRAYLK